MTSTNVSFSLCLSVVVALALGHVEAQWWHDRINVKIYNKIEPKMKAQVHCKDKNNDKGIKDLGSGEFYEFGFKPSAWGNTLYFCAVTWQGKVHWFDGYRHKRDFKNCRGKCVWNVRQNGPCLQFPNGEKGEKCYGWNPN